MTERNTNSVTGVYQLRYDAFALQANLRHDDSSQYGGKTTGGIALRLHAVAGVARDGGLQHRLQGAVVQRPLLSRTSPIRIWCRRRRATPKSARTGPRPTATWRWQARAIGYYNQVDSLIVFQCDADFNCAPQNVERATLKA